MQRDLLWGGGRINKKPHLLKWEVVCKTKDQGGLGLGKLPLLNKALLGEWIWRFASELNCTWKWVICFKYGAEELRWKPKDARGPYGVGL